MNLLIEVAKTLYIGICGGFDMMFSLFPLYNQISNLKEQLLSNITGIPEIIISTLFTIPVLFKLGKIIIKYL